MRLDSNSWREKTMELGENEIGGLILKYNVPGLGNEIFLPGCCDDAIDKYLPLLFEHHSMIGMAKLYAHPEGIEMRARIIGVLSYADSIFRGIQAGCIRGLCLSVPDAQAIPVIIDGQAQKIIHKAEPSEATICLVSGQPGTGITATGPRRRTRSAWDEAMLNDPMLNHAEWTQSKYVARFKSQNNSVEKEAFDEWFRTVQI
jgi:hypothetical protein